jgi:signal transduction histidine kinase
VKVILVSPNLADRALAAEFLRDHDIEAHECASVPEATGQIGDGVSCIVLVEEALESEGLAGFHEAMAMQPAWSDMPLVIVAARGGSIQSLMEGVFPIAGNMTLLQRPLHPLSLVSAVRVAQRSRARQYQVRNLLAEREAAVRQRDEFLAMLAHELRNPLAPIRYAAYLLGTQKDSTPLVDKCRTLIDKQARHITRLVDDLLDVSRLELGKIELRPQRVDLNEMAAAAVESCMPITSDQRHEVTLRTARQPIPVRVDPVRIEQAIGNLIVNAAKFTPAGGAIAVETRIEPGYGMVAISDNGIGIRADMLESIFELFTQSDVSIDRSKGGLGIGLTLVKRLVEMHGGSVKALSEGVGKGARFEARLPLVAAESSAMRAPKAHAVAVPRRVLVAEDGEDTREALGILLREWKHEVVFAADGPEAVRVAQAEHPDIALIDIGLPGFDGYKVAREIRAEGSAWARQVRLIALTGYGQASDRQRAMEAGFDLHLLKPVDPAKLEDVLAEV